ncbi:MAG TPA: glucose-6-phosphate dehydrogenase assembly protein OpcA [Oligoflexia bacterium]|mgnify:CR=1 FL=1|nr:glucose-6-phosphate dehydrogenase assembly protein OpcA [Oligoflexia bacterium]HMP47477.1 glucose-6-phosphate dehydrogenase assembly protein OpcA [Oligoflexia bacterium]
MSESLNPPADSSGIQTINVLPGGIESALEKLRKNGLVHDRTSADKPNKGGIRATLSNMIILARDNGEEDLIRILAENHPSRFFIVNYNNSLGEDLTTSITQRAVRGASGIPVKTEEIHIRVTPDSVKLVKNLVLSNLIPDIETITITTGTPGDNQREALLRESLLSISDTFIGSVGDLLDNYSSESVLSKESEASVVRKLDCYPLFFPRIARWCDLISEQFDSEEARKNLSNLSNVNIYYKPLNDSSSIPDEPVLMAVWILKSLNLKPTGVVSSGTDDGVTVVSTSGIKNQSGNGLSNEYSLPEEVLLSFRPVKKISLSNISSVSFEMNSGKNVSYVLTCSYLHSISAIEVSSGGFGESSDSTDAAIGEVCEFYVRRLPVQEISPAESAIQLIRGNGRREIIGEISELKSVLRQVL